MRVDNPEIDGEVVGGLAGPYLRTHGDSTNRNNLLDLLIL